MARVKSKVARHRRHKKILRAARGYRGGRSRLHRTAVETGMRAMRFAYRDRRRRKRDFRRLWITRISAAAAMNGLTYSRFMNGLKVAQIELDRKALAEIAFNDPSAFETLAGEAQRAISA